MEKYSQFADSTTGINPFVPLWDNFKKPKSSTGIVWRLIIRYMLKTPLAICRLCLATVPMLLLYITAHTTRWIFIRCVRRKIQGVVYYICCRWLLLLLGFWHIDAAHADHRRLKIRAPPTTTPSSSSSTSTSSSSLLSSATKSTDGSEILILANQTSFVEIIYFIMKINPTFVITHKDGTLSPVNWQTALTYSLTNNTQPPRNHHVVAGGFTSLLDLCDYVEEEGRGPLVLFPEGGKTNGVGVIQWRCEAWDEKAAGILESQCVVVGFAYEGTGGEEVKQAYTPPHTVYGCWQHLFFLCSEWNHRLQVRWIGRDSVSRALQGSDDKDEAIELLRNIMCRLLPRAISLDSVSSKTLTAFSDYWNGTYNKVKYNTKTIKHRKQ
eukprot:GHVS01090738.1.p1 GENE.GHVS01090738.1~~GHVS01090738.1.p1  ORF type:complete len:381 (+),score=46.38 GHVS01090738.1:299-1441(+)